MENKKKVDISANGLEKLLDQSLGSFEEERDLAIERYRRQDEMMQSADDFVLQGRFAVDYLKIAADRSNAIFGIAKLVKDILYKDDSGPGGVKGSSGSGVGDNQKSEILKLIKEMDEKKDEKAE